MRITHVMSPLAEVRGQAQLSPLRTRNAVAGIQSAA
jgi:hypothetical protein